MRFTIVLLFLAVALPLTAQDASRQVWDSGFRQKRPAASKQAEPTTKAAIDYRLQTKPELSAGSSARLIGFTVWRLRKPSERDTEAPRLLLQEPGQRSSEYVAERIGVSEALRAGDRVRLGVEVAGAGYLYVINRERSTRTAQSELQC